MHTDWIEIAWTAISLSGLVIVVVNYVNAQRSYSVLNGDRDMRIIAHAHVRREAMRILVQVLMTSAGIIAMFRPPAPDTESAGRLVMVGIFIAFALLNNVNSELDRQVRNKLRRDQ